MGKSRRRSSRNPTTGGFANADIPSGFENPRIRLRDAPLVGRGRVIYLSVLVVVIVGGIALIWIAASQS